MQKQEHACRYEEQEGVSVEQKKQVRESVGTIGKLGSHRDLVGRHEDFSFNSES